MQFAVCNPALTFQLLTPLMKGVLPSTVDQLSLPPKEALRPSVETKMEGPTAFLSKVNATPGDEVSEARSHHSPTLARPGSLHLALTTYFLPGNRFSTTHELDGPE